MRLFALLAAVAVAALCGVAPADPPRAVRVQVVNGGYSYQPYTYQYTYPQPYSYYSPPKITYLLIVPTEQPQQVEQPKAPAKVDPNYLKEKKEPKKEASKAPEPKRVLSAVDDVAPPELAKDVVGVLTRHCVSCHNPENAKAGLSLVAGQPGDWKLASLTKNQWWEVYGRANAGQMPPGAVKDATKALPEADLLPLLKRAGLK